MEPDHALIVRGRVLTMDDAHPTAEAVLVRGRHIAAVGAYDELRSLAPGAAVIDARDGLVLPGLVDGHAHLSSLGRALSSVSLDDAASLDDVVARARSWAACHPDGWIVGRGWDQTRWPGDESFPDAAPLDVAFPDRPVFLVRIDGHAALVNRAALRVAGVRDDVADPPGGRLLRRADGSLSGVLVDTAMNLVSDRIPPATRTERRRWIEVASQHALAAGLTGVHDAAVSVEADEAFVELAAAQALPIRVHGMADLSDRRGLELVAAGPRPERALYSLAAVKLFADGALGSRGALLFAPYCDDPSHAGLAVQDLPELQAKAEIAARAGFQLCVHAIGDRANARVLDLIASLRSAGFALRRPRIEHAQILRPEDVPRFRDLGVIASMQPAHATSDRRYAERRLGKARLVGAYAWKTLLDHGVVVSFGSDFPIETADPLDGLRAAVLRQDREGEPPGGWRPHERLTPDAAYFAWTAANAYAVAREHELGLLRPGFLADITVLGGDPFADGIFERVPVLATIVDGAVRFRG